jgi:hypothetical protein
MGERQGRTKPFEQSKLLVYQSVNISVYNLFLRPVIQIPGSPIMSIAHLSLSAAFFSFVTEGLSQQALQIIKQPQ